MKSLFLSTSIAVMLLASTAAFAAPAHGQGDHGRQVRGHDNQRDNDYRSGHGQANQRWAQNGGHDNGRHLGQRKHAFRRGERVPSIYLQPRYYVRDYTTYHLAPPPRGYRWVRPADGHYLLVATATGLISQLLGY